MYWERFLRKIKPNQIFRDHFTFFAALNFMGNVVSIENSV